MRTIWEINQEIDDIINKNILYEGFEQYEVDKYSLKNDFIEFIKKLSVSDIVKLQERHSL